MGPSKDSVLSGVGPQEREEPAEAAWREVGLRYFFKGQKAGQGKICVFRCPGEKGTVPARAIRACLCNEAGVNLSRFAAFSYCNSWGGFLPLPHGDEEAVSTVPSLAGRPQKVPSEQQPSGEQPPERECVDVQLEETMGFTSRALQELRLEAPAGFFGIGIVRGKTETNHGLLWRSAFQLGASFTFSVGARYDQRRDGMTDRAHCASSCPQWSFVDFAAFAQSLPFGAPLVAVEMGGEPLDAFEHPSRCIYVLGSEDAGIESSVLQACHAVVSIPSLRSASFNVANAGSIVMYDRLAKERASQLLKQ
ncbi:unnamed protein product [Prorocentrum cordatum]|uniref:tRNA/rRNA methyltransferase SpoU type domain-containing protein n=1 Tax=Prorocentrum cordatum TaxID=2364126 RepID=A0ABN9RI70_9DINO|nr:unnamed protein product [Polarella glacialis]